MTAAPKPLLALALLAGVAATLWLLDRFLLRLEEKGYLYYRRKRATRSRLGAAFLEVQAILEPDKRHAARIRREKGPESAGAEAPPEPGNPGCRV